MKKFVNTLFGVAMAAFLVVGCEKSDDGRNPGGEVTPQVLEAFSVRYPGAQNVSWTVKDGYAVASFSWNDPQASSSTGVHSAWFDNQGGSWSMTETEIPYSALPQAVKTAFESSEYASWQIDREVDVLTRSGEVEPEIYVIEAEQAGSEVDLYYSPDGVLVKTMADAGPNYDYGDFIPSKPTSGVDEYIAAHYPGARIVDVDRESEGTEVEIIDGGVARDVCFDRNGSWLYTKTEIRRTELPAAVTGAWAGSEYAEAQGYRLDDADYFETAAEGSYYRLELESRNGDVKLKITPEGELSLYEPTFNGGAGVPTDVDTFIRENYSGATILEQEVDNGYLEVEIRHDGREKSVFFNGAGAWVKTTWEVRRNELPAAVTQTVAASQYASWEFDGADFVQSPDGEWYEVELEQERPEQEVKLRVAANGTVLA